MNIMTKLKAFGRSLTIIGLLATGLLSGCGYGEVTPHGYEYAKALYSICNRKDAERLETFVGMLESDVREGKLTDAEADWFRDIADQAGQGNWTSASANARRLLEDQVQGR